nr:acetoacetate--CoA ligase [Rhodococcus tukisamuensis]
MWTPSHEQIADATLTRFQERVRATQGLEFADYEDLWNWSVTDLEGFWSSVWDFFGLDEESGYDQVLADDAMPGARWFPGAELNFARFLLGRGDPDATAIIYIAESGDRTEVTWAELREQVLALAAELGAAGVGVGDVVAGYLPNIAEAVVAFLGTVAIGAVWSSVGQDYAAQAVVDRFGQLEPRVLIAADGYRFNGQLHSRVAAVDEIVAQLPSVTEVIVIDNVGDQGNVAEVRDSRPSVKWRRWNEAMAAEGLGFFVSVPFDHPLWVLFSSGTTGRPKGLVHGHGGVLIEKVKQTGLHWDLRADDRLFWYTSPSWMMWNTQVSSLLCGGSIVCYDGSPTYLGSSCLWQIAADLDVTFLGVSPGYLQSCANDGVRPAEQFDLHRLRAMGSTGSPLAAHLQVWARDHVGDLPLWSMSGGTDLASALVGGVPTLPVWAGKISARCLGAAVDAWDEQGNAVEGGVGELVIRRPLPSMPIKLWNDHEGAKYRDAYFDGYPGVWRQGDWVTIDDNGAVVIHGRSDSTLNRNGIRMGSSDIYAVVESMPEVVEALVIGAEQSDGTYWMPLFVVLEPDWHLDASVRNHIKSEIREKLSPRHVPDEIFAVPALPHTRTGKKIEVPIKRILQGAEVDEVISSDAVDDASLLDFFHGLAASRRAVSAIS